MEIALLSAFLAVSLATAGYLVRRLDRIEGRVTNSHEALLAVLSGQGERLARIEGRLEGRDEALSGS